MNLRIISGNQIVDGDNRYVAQLSPPNEKEFGPFIVHAVNCHQELIDALKYIVSAARDYKLPTNASTSAFDHIEKHALYALQRAEGIQEKEGKA